MHRVRWCVTCPSRWSAWVHVAWAAASPRPVSCRMQSRPPRWSAGQVSMLGGLGQIAAEPAAAVRPPPVSGGNRAALPQVNNAVRILTDPNCLHLLHSLLFLFMILNLCECEGECWKSCFPKQTAVWLECLVKVVFMIFFFFFTNNTLFYLTLFSYFSHSVLQMFVLMYLCSCVSEKIQLAQFISPTCPSTLHTSF